MRTARGVSGKVFGVGRSLRFASDPCVQDCLVAAGTMGKDLLQTDEVFSGLCRLIMRESAYSLRRQDDSLEALRSVTRGKGLSRMSRCMRTESIRLIHR